MTNDATTQLGRRTALVLGLFGGIIGGVNSPTRGDEPRPIPPFATEVEANFKAWDLNGDGTVSFEETTRLVPRDTFRDTAAAALAAVHLGQRRGVTRNAAFPRDVLLAATPSSSTVRPHFELYYFAALAHIRSTNRTLFAGGGPTLAAVRQGPLGDCYFVATLGAMINRNPKDLDRIVRVTPDGPFQVQFPNGESVRIFRVTDAELALGSFAEGQGVWLNVLEKAYGELIERTLLRRGVVENAIDALGDGGRPTAAMALLTGCDAGLLRFRPEDPRAVPTDRRVDGFLPLTRGLLAGNVERRLLTCCATSEADVPPGMAEQHLYAVLGFDVERDVVHLWNPWGNSFDPNGPPGLATGYITRQGRFSVPVADFIRIFDAVFYETNRPIGE